MRVFRKDISVKENKIIPSGALVQSHEESLLCYGHFNLIHPGHIRFLEKAKEMGGRLFVAVTGDSSCDADEAQFFFSGIERAESVAAITIVDHVILMGEASLKDIISVLRPTILFLGKEFEFEREQEVEGAIRLHKELGGRVKYHSGEIHYASSNLLKRGISDVKSDRIRLFRRACERQKISLESLRYSIDKFSRANLLVIGDTIVDHYVACDALGMSSEAPVIVVKELESQRYIGGAGIVASHIACLGGTCHYLSVVGDDSEANFVREELERFKVIHNLVVDSSRPTTFKTRFLVENQKLFRVSRLVDHDLDSSFEEKIIQEIIRIAPTIGGILISDFVYGVITPRILEAIRAQANKYNLLLIGDIQCSSQFGDIKKFKQFNLLCPTEKEARYALGSRDEGIEWVANSLIKNTGARNLFLKLGSDGFIAYQDNDGFVNRQHFPAINANPLDLMGAGDSLLAASSVSLAAGVSLMESAALGACMASLAVQKLGNQPINSGELIDLINDIWMENE